MSNPAMEAKVHELMELKRMKEELEAEITATEDAIKAVMGDEETLIAGAYKMLDPRRKEVSVNLVKKLCDGLDITLGEFFSAPVFDELEQEIQ